MRTFAFRTTILLAALAAIASTATITESQSTGQDTSLWNKLKNAANQGAQQKPGAQPQKPGQNPAPAQKQSAAGPINETGPFTPPPGTKIDEAVMAPIEQGAQFAISPKGIHMATLSHSGSRLVIIYDGVPGPKFDQIFNQGGPVGVVFSPNGSRYAYCAASGNEWVVMVDGKELTRGPAAANGMMGTPNCTLGFTSNSKHVYFMSVDNASNVSSYSRFVFDGKPGPLGADSDLRNYAFSPDGNHFAYIWTEPVPRPTRNQLIIDNQTAPYLAGEPQWSADSQHLFTKRSIPVPNSRHGSVKEVLLDGKPFMRADNVTLYIPPVGDMLVAKVLRDASPQSMFLVIGGKPVPGSETIGTISDVTFSPDGKHFAAIYSSAAQRQFAFIDGKKGLEYARLDGFTVANKLYRILFTADSSKSAYLGFNAVNNGEFLVYDGNESDTILTVNETAVSPAGGHLATAGQGQLTMDGKILNLPGVNPHTTQIAALSFSPDGSHYAFVLRDRGNTTLYLDGAPQTSYSPASAGPLDNISSRPYLWSPDSKHIAYLCRTSNPADQYLCVDDKAVRIGVANAYNNLSFAGDSNHLIWVRNMGQSITRIFVDGKPVEEGFTPSVGGFVKETWQIGSDGNLLALLQDNTSMKRVSIAPSPSTSLATLFGGATTIAGGK